jgi:predicted ATPase
VAAKQSDDLTALRTAEGATATGLDGVFSSWVAGLDALKSGDLNAAESAMRAVVTAPKSKRCNATDVLGLCGLARVNLAQGMTDPAEEMVGRAKAAAKEACGALWGWVYATQARIAQHAGDPSRATEAWRDAVDAFRDAEAWTWATEAVDGLVPTSIAAGAPGRAVSALQLVPDAPDAVNGARLALARAELAEAMGDVQRALRLTEDMPAESAIPDVAHRFAALRIRCAHVTGVAAPDVDFPAPETASAEGVRLLLNAAAAGIVSPSIVALQTRADVLDRPDLAAMAAGLSARNAAIASDSDAAIFHLTHAERMAQRSGNAACQLRTARQRARIELDLGLGAPARIRSLLQVHLEQARASGDTLAEAHARMLLAQCVPVVPDEVAATHAAAACALGKQRGYRPLAEVAEALAAVFDHDLDLPDFSEKAPLGVAMSYMALLARSPNVNEAVEHLHRTHHLINTSAIPRSRALRRVMRRAMALAGLQMIAEGIGPDLVVHAETGQYWIEGIPLTKIRPSSIPFRLLMTIAVEGSRLNKEALFEKVWEQEYRPPSSDNTLYVNLHRLRSRVADGIVIDPTEDGGYAIRDRPSVFQWFDEPPLKPLNPFPTISPAADPREQAVIETNIPVPSNAFIGRRLGLAELMKRYGTGARLVTLTGPVGTGKTRLAQHFGRDQAERHAHPGGVWFAAIDGRSDKDAFMTAVARAMDVPLLGEDSAPAADQLQEEIAARGDLMLILDAVDGLSSEVAETVEAWLWAAPQLRILTTTTVPLGCTSERQVQLEPMSEDDAVTLFTERTKLVRPGFQLMNNLRPTVVGLVSKLDRLPLAIEMAAARMDLVDAEELYAKVTDRFGTMASEGDALDKAIRWSWELLDGWEQSVLSQCSVFRGGFTAKDAEAVIHLDEANAPWVGDVVNALRRRSMIQSRDGVGLATPRFALLRTVADFAVRRISDPEAIEERHADHTIAQGEARLAGLSSAGGPACLTQLIDDVDNTLAVVERFRGRNLSRAARAMLIAAEALGRIGPLGQLIQMLDQTAQVHTALDPTLGLRVLLAQARYAVQVNPAAAGPALEQASAQAEAVTDKRVLGEMAYAHGWVWMHRPGRLADAIVAFEEAKALFEAAGHTAGVALTLQRLGVTHLWQGDPGRGASLLEEAVALHESIGDVLHLAPALGNLGSCERALGRDGAIRTLQRALSQAQENQDAALVGTVHANLANAYHGRWRIDAARFHYGEAIEQLRRAGRHRQSAIAQFNLGVMRAAQGDGDAARSHLRRARNRLQSVGERGVVDRVSLQLAHAHLDAGEGDLASEMLNEARKTIADHGPQSPARRTLIELEGALALDQGDLDTARTAWAGLIPDDPDPAVQVQLAFVDHMAGQLDQARDGYTAALATLQTVQFERLHGRIQLRLACALSALGQTEAASGAMNKARARFEATQDMVGLRNLEVLIRCGLPNAEEVASASATVVPGGLEQRLLLRSFQPQ